MNYQEITICNDANREIRANREPERLPDLIDLRNNAVRIADACQTILTLKDVL